MSFQLKSTESIRSLAQRDADRIPTGPIPQAGSEEPTVMNASSNPAQARLLTEDAVAAQLSCSVALLRKWRRVGGGVAVVRIGRLVRYREEDLRAYIDTHRVTAA